MTNVDVRTWGKANLWPLASGELAVRPGLRRVLSPDGSRVFVGGFSVLNPFTGECWSYVFDCTSSVSTPRDLRLRVYDEDWQIFQTLSLNINTVPRAITHCVVEGQILICSPDMPTLWGLVGSNGTAWQILNHSESYTFASSCVVNGRVFALSKDGYRLVDVENNDDTMLSDMVAPRQFGPRLASDDWREANMYAGDAGPVVAFRDAVSMHNISDETRSWWKRPDSGTAFAVVGVLKTVDGTDLILSADGVYEMAGNFDGDLTATPAATQPKGLVYGRVRTDVGTNPMARDIRAAASLGGEGSVRVSVRGETPTAVTPPVDARALVVGTSSWGDARIYEPAPMAAIRTQHNLDTHDMTVEVAFDLCETRIADTIDFTGSESATKRPGERGQG